MTSVALILQDNNCFLFHVSGMSIEITHAQNKSFLFGIICIICFKKGVWVGQHSTGRNCLLLENLSHSYFLVSSCYRLLFGCCFFLCLLLFSPLVFVLVFLNLIATLFFFAYSSSKTLSIVFLFSRLVVFW